MTSLVVIVKLSFSKINGHRMTQGERWLKAIYPVAIQFVGQCINPVGDVSYSAAGYVPRFLFGYPVLLWVLGSVTYILAGRILTKYLGRASLLSQIVAWSFCSLGLVYKMSSTLPFNPELLDYVPQWFRVIIVQLDHNAVLRAYWLSLTGCFIFLLLRSRSLAHMNQSGGYLHFAFSSILVIGS